jgi:flagellar biosynthesis anti-sigma factor FlgM
MKVNDSNLISTTSSGDTARAQEAARTASAARTQADGSAAAGFGQDDVHLSELVRSLRSLAADSPERQAKIEQLTRAHASGNYKVDVQATASAIIDDAFKQI